MDYSKYFNFIDGTLYWKERDRCDFSSVKGYRIHLARYAGKPAGNLGANGYLYVRVCKRLELVHRVIWQMHNRDLLPGEEIDHKDTCRLNNSLSNLRLASRHQNGCNTNIPAHNTSGFKGVSLHKKTGRYAAYYKMHGKKHHIGYFSSAEQAHRAYSYAVSKVFGEFSKP